MRLRTITVLGVGLAMSLAAGCTPPDAPTGAPTDQVASEGGATAAVSDGDATAAASDGGATTEPVGGCRRH